MTDLIRHPDPGAVDEVEALGAELAAELREMREMVRAYRDTIAQAARYIAAGLADRTDPHGQELAGALARMSGISEEIEQLLPAAAPRAAPSRR
ncbi:MAG: hypothetical protein ACRD0K_21905 [Egibacteraceae bacterium]